MMIAKKSLTKNHSPAGGFSIFELLIVVALVGILMTFALMGVIRARSSYRVSEAVSTLQSFLEKAISDAKLRNAKGDARSRVRVLTANTYEVRMDFDSDGAIETRIITLPAQTSFQYDPANPPRATIDWRGYVAENDVSYVVIGDDGQTSAVRLTGIGDASNNAALPTLPTVSVTPVSTDVKPTASLIGNSTPNPYASPTPTPTPLPFCTGTQLPASTPCRCAVGKSVDTSGKCK